jgi:hypothetical protein
VRGSETVETFERWLSWGVTALIMLGLFVFAHLITGRRRDLLLTWYRRVLSGAQSEPVPIRQLALNAPVISAVTPISQGVLFGFRIGKYSSLSLRAKRSNPLLLAGDCFSVGYNAPSASQ